ncbi:anaerobic ribonucleoside-triphosphate reductase [Pleomorphomonas sp. NRK KF1]|uniref:anaerobic ribonucleoside-triphosphate reductase n=1 Tax=Pleomorphomonas sp. NRK KF1 TaxID=2943000 RepID=UPI0020432547|nr:anaerobic ribonucleoside-triphosphate reductase [Pleomorphomonas sp. NRK KF1]MCM5554814.1 anaerobic ribonucleoside-triphosphate reductase [Pleomorphomonas sp. NRK KF1]
MNKPLSTVDTAVSIQLTDDERQPCEIWTRVMGYHRPVSSFNKGKRSEFAERTSFTEAKSQGDVAR